MACTYTLAAGQTLAQRISQVEQALKRLEKALTLGQVKIAIGPTGAVAFQGWATNQRDGISDTCAYRSLMAQSSFALRTAVMKAEAMSGRKVNVAAVAAGHHTHDGKTWYKGH